MYSYNGLPQQGQQQQAQPMQHMSRPSPPQPTWAVPQTHNPYYQMPRSQAMSSRDDARHMLGRSDVVTAQSPVSSNTPFTNSMHGSNHLATTDYFPGVIDTSKSPFQQFLQQQTHVQRSMGPESMRRTGIFSLSGSRGRRLQSWIDSTRRKHTHHRPATVPRDGTSRA
jgi:hypothetical protein